MQVTWRVNGTDFVWGDLPPDETAARIASKHPYKKTEPGAPLSEPVGEPPADMLMQYELGGTYEVLWRRVPATRVDGVPYPVTYQYGARHTVTKNETWAPLGSEYETRPDVTVGSVRNLCGIVTLEQKVASLEAQNRRLQARLDALEQAQHVSVRTKG